jgi:hypothetical protein
MSAKLPKLVCAVAFAAIVIAGCGRASVSSAPVDPGFASLDTNQDGRLSPGESYMVNEKFSAMDQNGDGFLSQLEWQGASAGTQTPWLIQENNEAMRSPRPVGPGTW